MGFCIMCEIIIPVWTNNIWKIMSCVGYCISSVNYHAYLISELKGTPRSRALHMFRYMKPNWKS